MSDVANSLDYRFAGLNDFSNTFKAKGNGIIEVTRNEQSNNSNNILSERKAFEKAIVKKPTLIFTDVEMRPIFTNGLFIENAPQIDYSNIEKYAVPIKADSTVVKYAINGLPYVQGNFANNAAVVEWTKATQSISNREKIVLMWLNLDEFVNLARTDFPNEWKKAKENAANFAFVNETPFDAATQKLNLTKKHTVDASKYLISIARMETSTYDNKFFIQSASDGSYLTKVKAKALASNINFGSNDKLQLSIKEQPIVISSKETKYNFNHMWIAGIVIFSLIAIMLMVNYGLLGALSTISMSLFVFLTLLMFTVLRGDYSPASVVGIFGGLAIGLLSPILTLNNFKKDLSKGEKVKKAWRNANSAVFMNLLDTNLIAIISAIIFFFMGTTEMKNFSIITIFSGIFSILVMLLINRMWCSLIIHTDLFENKLNWFGLSFSKKQNNNFEAKYKKFNFVHLGKILMFIPIALIAIGLLVYSIHAGIGKSIWQGLNNTDIFADKSNINIKIEIVALVKALAIILAVISIYTLARYKWTYMIVNAVVFITSLSVIFSLFAFARIPFNSTTIMIFLMNVIFTQIQLFTLFGALKTKLNNEERISAFTKEQIRSFSNSMFYDQFKNYLYIALTNIISFGLLLAIYKSSDIYLNVLILLSTLIATYLVLFVGISLWSKFEEIRQHNIQRRIDTKYWVIPNIPEEQVFPGINSIQTH